MGTPPMSASNEADDSTQRGSAGDTCRDVCEQDTCCFCFGVQEGTQVLAITSIVNGILRCIPAAGGKGHMFIPGMITGVMQLCLGVYGYFGAEQCDARKVKHYFYRMLLV